MSEFSARALLRFGSMATSSPLAKWTVASCSSSSWVSLVSWPVLSMAVLRHTGMEGTRAPRVWINSTVTISWGFLKTCSSRTAKAHYLRGTQSSREQQAASKPETPHKGWKTQKQTAKAARAMLTQHTGQLDSKSRAVHIDCRALSTATKKLEDRHRSKTEFRRTQTLQGFKKHLAEESIWNRVFSLHRCVGKQHESVKYEEIGLYHKPNYWSDRQKSVVERLECL